MRSIPVAALAALVLALSGPAGARADDPADVAKLKERVATLEAKLKLAEKENELLKKELSLSRSEKTLATKPKADSSLSARLPVDTVLSGSEKFENRLAGKLVITITDRQGDKVKAAYLFDGRDPNGKAVRANRDLEGEVAINQVTFKSVGAATRINMTLSMSGDSLTGTVSHSEIGKGSVGLKFPVPK